MKSHGKAAMIGGVVVLLVTVCGILFAQSADWPTFRKDAQRNGVDDGISPFEFPLGKRWSQFVDPEENVNIEASPVVADNKVFIGSLGNFGPSYPDHLYVLDLGTGEILKSWGSSDNVGMIWATPTYHNGKVYVFDWGGYIHRLDVSDPDPNNWSKDWELQIIESAGDISMDYFWVTRERTSPLIIEDPVDGDKLIVLTQEIKYDSYSYEFLESIGKIFCVNPDSPSENIWGPIDIGEVHYSSPAYSEDKLIMTGYTMVPDGGYGQEVEGTVYARDIATGEIIWQNMVAPNGAIVSTPAIHNGKVYVGTREGFDSKLHRLDLNTGNLDWSIAIADLQIELYPDLNEMWTSPTVAYGKVYFASYSTLHCAVDGDVPLPCPGWIPFNPGFLLFSSPSISNGVVYISTDDYYSVADPPRENQALFALDANDGTVIWQYQDALQQWIGSAQTSPALAEGAVVFASYDAPGASGVYCFQSGTGCGDGAIGDGEVCDGNSQACTTIDGYEGTQDCNSECSGFDECISDWYCGDGFVNGPELCDGNSQACTTIDGYAGTQSCNAACTGFDACTSNLYCGDGIVNGNEICDTETQACITIDGYEGTQDCNGQCTGFDECIRIFYCGDGYCSGATQGEDCATCPQDCLGGQGGMCSACWKGRCDGYCNERKETSECADCAGDYCCGDGICSFGEDVYNCQIDCGCVSDADCGDGQSCTMDFCNNGICENIWPACGFADGCCASDCTPATDPDCQDCSACFKGVCDGECHPRKDGPGCPDCA
ncbi:PQQ-binding-like beta-propeller repeat protein [Candidatus Omnitrophota bacterium]